MQSELKVIAKEYSRPLREVERFTRNPEKLPNAGNRCWKDTLWRKRSFRTHRPSYPTRRGLFTAWPETKELLQWNREIWRSLIRASSSACCWKKEEKEKKTKEGFDLRDSCGRFFLSKNSYSIYLGIYNAFGIRYTRILFSVFSSLKSFSYSESANTSIWSV